ncbi:hypothetical protein HHK36_011316 [Tetracentron sinense]|uniref:Uncharacterized protein n=1 Tax=Tetracentron sinense TaxID=13715 RepID=A0A835DJS3_TETSI|nr:hypothetical protein HHK36_011316 [Tetracentron sinense]
MQPSNALSDYISFHDPCPSNSPLSSAHSSAGSQPLPPVTESTPCKSCALELNPSRSTSMPLPHVPTPITETVPDMPAAPVPNSSSTQNSHPMQRKRKNLDDEGTSNCNVPLILLSDNNVIESSSKEHEY